jgi:hypothetical protein
MWRELCWRYVVFPAQAGNRPSEIVFAVYLRPHRPVIHAALVDSASGEVLPWPVPPSRRRRVFGGNPLWDSPGESQRDGVDAGYGLGAGPGAGCGSDSGRIPAGMLSAPTDPGRHIPAIRAEPPAHSPPDDLPFSRDL